MNTKNKFDFIVIGSHGTGIHAAKTYINQIQSCTTLLEYGRKTIDAILPFLKNNYRLKKGLILETSEYTDRDIGIILSSCNKQIPVIILTRDPVEQLQSVVNGHIRYWADASINVTTRNLESTLMYIYGTVENLYTSLFKLPAMWATVTLPPFLATRTGSIQVFDITDLAPENGTKTMSILSKLILGTPDGWSGTMPNTLMFSKANRVIALANKLICRGKFSFTASPCPSSFCVPLKINPDLILEYNPKEICFNMGEFEGDIAFVFSQDEFDASHLSCAEYMSTAKHILDYDDKSILKNYCRQLSQRNETAAKMAEGFYLSFSKMIQMAKQNSEVLSLTRNYIHQYINSISQYNPSIVEKWHTSKFVLAELEN